MFTTNFALPESCILSHQQRLMRHMHPYAHLIFQLLNVLHTENPNTNIWYDDYEIPLWRKRKIKEFKLCINSSCKKSEFVSIVLYFSFFNNPYLCIGAIWKKAFLIAFLTLCVAAGHVEHHICGTSKCLCCNFFNKFKPVSFTVCTRC